MGALKPEINAFVEHGFAAIQTAEMKETIIKAFQNDGLFELMRSPEQTLIAAEEAFATLQNNINNAKTNLPLTLPFTFGDLRAAISDEVELDKHEEELEDEGNVNDDFDNEKDN
jgi:hypothetical protein